MDKKQIKYFHPVDQSITIATFAYNAEKEQVELYDAEGVVVHTAAFPPQERPLTELSQDELYDFLITKYDAYFAAVDGEFNAPLEEELEE